MAMATGMMPGASAAAEAPRSLTIPELLASMTLAPAVAKDGTRVEPRTQALALGAIYLLQSIPRLTPAEYATLLTRYNPADPRVSAIDAQRCDRRGASFTRIAAVAGLDDNTAGRAIEVLSREISGPPEAGGRDAIIAVAERGKGGKASRYSFNWTQMKPLCSDDLLPIFQAAEDAGLLDPVGSSLTPVAIPLTPVEPPLTPVACNGGRGGNFLVPKEQESASVSRTQEQLPPPPPPKALHGGEVETHGGERQWAAIYRRLQRAKVRSEPHRRQWTSAALRNGWTLGQVDGLLAFLAQHAAAWKSPTGLIGDALGLLPPADDDWLSLLPDPKPSYSFDAKRAIEQADRRQAETAEQRRGRIVQDCRHEAKLRQLSHDEAHELTNQALRNAGLEPLATITESRPRPREPHDPGENKPP